MAYNVPVVTDVASPPTRQTVGLRGLAMWVREAWERSDLADRTPSRFSGEAVTILLSEVAICFIFFPITYLFYMYNL